MGFTPSYKNKFNKLKSMMYDLILDDYINRQDITTGDAFVLDNERQEWKPNSKYDIPKPEDTDAGMKRVTLYSDTAPTASDPGKKDKMFNYTITDKLGRPKDVKFGKEFISVEEIKNVRILYNSNGAGVNPVQQMGYTKDTLTILDNPFEYEGYKFLRWNTEADGSGITYNPGDVIQCTTSFTLYAQWKIIIRAELMTGTEVNAALKNLAAGITTTSTPGLLMGSNVGKSYTDVDTLIKNIVRVDAPLVGINSTTISKPDSPKECIAYFSNYVVYIYADGVISLNPNSAYLFSNMRQLVSLDGFEEAATDNATNFADMFYYDIRLANINGLRNWDISSVEHMEYMFNQCTVLTNVSALADWDVSKVKNMENMFGHCDGLTSISTLTNWSPKSVINMSNMFSYSGLAAVSNVEGWDVSSVTNMFNMFAECPYLRTVDGLQGWKTDALIDIHRMFYKDSSLTSVNGFTDWKTSNVTTMVEMFYQCESLNDISGLANLDTHSVTNMTSLFYECRNLENISAVANWNVGGLTTLNNVFQSTKITNLNSIRNWDTSNIVHIDGLFASCTSLVDISAFRFLNLNKCLNIPAIFFGCTSLTSLVGLEHLNVKYSIDRMFYNCTSLVDLSPIANWDTSSLQNMSSAFYNTGITSIAQLSNWNLQNVYHMGNVFGSCDNLTDISAFNSWNLSSVTIFTELFTGCVSLTDISPLANLIPSTRTDDVFIESMFKNCTSLTDISPLSNWDMTHVRHIAGLFFKCSALTNISPLSVWRFNNHINSIASAFAYTAVNSATALDSWNLVNDNGVVRNGSGGVVTISGMFSNSPIVTHKGRYPVWHPEFSGYTGLKTGQQINSIFKSLAAGSSSLVPYTSSNSNIHNIVISNIAPTGLYMNISESDDNPCYASYSNNTIYVYQESRPKSGTNLACLFYNMTGLKNVSYFSNVDTENMNNFGSALCYTPADIDLSPLADWNTSNLANINKLFEFSYIPNIDFMANWDMSKVKSLSYAFYQCSITNMNGARNWNIAPTSLAYAFSSSGLLSDISGMENWDMSGVTTLDHAFYGCSGLTSLASIANWNLPTNVFIEYAFAYTGITNLDGFKSLEIAPTSLNYVFRSCNNLTDISGIGDINWTNVRTIESLFYGCMSLSNILPLKDVNVSAITSMSNLLYMTNVSDLSPLNNWNISTTCTKNRMFSKTPITTLNGIKNWKTIKFISFEDMFSECESLTDISALADFDFSECKNFTNAFKKCTSLVNVSPLANAVTSACTSLSGMFNGDTSNMLITDISSLSGWDVSNVTNMSNLFRKTGITSCEAIASWNVDRVTDITKIFEYTGMTGCTYIDRWSFTNVDGVVKNSLGNTVSVSNMLDNTPIATEYKKYPIWHPLFSGMTILKSGSDFNAAVKSLINPSASYSTVDNSIKRFELSDTMPTSNYVVVSLAEYTPCYASFDTETGTVYLYSTERILANSSCGYMFNNMAALIDDLRGINEISFKNATSFYYMFSGCTSLASINTLKDLDVSNITSFECMFNGCTALSNITGMESWNVSKVRNINFMFSGCTSLTSTYGISTFTLSNISHVFDNCSKLNDISSLSAWNIAGCTSLEYLFSGCKALRDIYPISSWNVKDVTSFAGMFNGCIGLTNISSLYGWEISNNVSSFASMFSGCTFLSSATYLDQWNLVNRGTVTKNKSDNDVSLSNMFAGTAMATTYTEYPVWHYQSTGCGVLKSGQELNAAFKSLASGVVKAYTDTDTLIQNIKITSTAPTGTVGVDYIVVSAVDSAYPCYATWENSTKTIYIYGHRGISITNASYLFYGMKALVDISSLSMWRTSSLTSIAYMFAYSSATHTLVNQITDWKSSLLTDMSYMFMLDYALDEIPSFTRWEMNHITNANYAFDGCTSLANASGFSCIFSGNTGNITLEHTFDGCSYLSNISGLSSIDASHITSMRSMFNNCTELDDQDLAIIGNWRPSIVTDLSGMFTGCSGFTSGRALDSWNLTNETTKTTNTLGQEVNLGGMFSGCSFETNYLLYPLWHKDHMFVATLKTGREINAALKALSNGWEVPYTYTDSKIEYINKSNVVPTGTLGTDYKDIATSDSDVPIYASWDATNKTINIYSKASNLYANADMSYLLYYFHALLGIEALSHWNMSTCTSLSRAFNDLWNSRRNMDFSGIQNWDISNVTNMEGIFSSTYLSPTQMSYISGWNTGNVTNMMYAFSMSVDTRNFSAISGWNVSKVKNMNYMFGETGWNVAPLINDLSFMSTWNTASLETVKGMFRFCINLTSLSGLENLDMSHVTDMSYMFSECGALADISAISGWITDSVVNISYMFGRAARVGGGPVQITNMNALSSWNISNVTYLSGLACMCTLLTDISGLANWITSSVISAYDVFKSCSSLSDLNGIQNWNLSNATAIGSMFEGCSSLTNVSLLANWNLLKVVDMNYIFRSTGLTSATRLDIWPLTKDGTIVKNSLGNTVSINSMFDSTPMATSYGKYPVWHPNCPGVSLLKTGSGVKTDFETLAGSRNNVRIIVKSDTMPTGTLGVDYLNVASSGVPCYASYDSSSYTIKVYCEGRIRLVGSGSEFLYRLEKLSDISWLSEIDVSGCTSLSSFLDTSGGVNLTPISEWDVSNVKSLSSAFRQCSISNLSPISGWNVSNVTNMKQMFMSSLLSNFNDISEWNTSKVTDMSYFAANSRISSFSGLESWDVSNVTNMSYIFGSTSTSTSGYMYYSSLDGLENWDVSNVTDMSYAFAIASRVTDSSAISGWNTASLTNATGMFKFSSIGATNLSNWDMSHVTNMESIFNNNTATINATDLANWNVSNVTSFKYAFYSSKLTNYEGFTNWNTSSATDMEGMFACATGSLSLHGLENWNVSNVTNMSSMFRKNSSIALDISALENWDVSNVTNMSSMFSILSAAADDSLNISALSRWNVSKVISMSGMFNCRRIADLSPLLNWNTASLTSMTKMFYTCKYTTSLHGLENFNVSKVTDFTNIFAYCSALTDISALANWDVSKVTTMERTFESCTALADISGLYNWTTFALTNLLSTFNSCKALTSLHGLENWDMTHLTQPSESYGRGLKETFANCTALTDISAVKNWSMPNLTILYGTFRDCYALSDVSPVSYWNVDNKVSINSLFRACFGITDMSMFDHWFTRNSSGQIINNNGGVVSSFADFFPTTNVPAKNYPCWWAGFPGLATLKTGKEISAALKTLANGTPKAYNDTDGVIRQIQYSTTAPTGVEGENYVNIATTDSTIPCYASISDGIVYLYSAGRIKAGADLSYMCYQMSNLDYIPGLRYIDTSLTENLSYIFYYDSDLGDITPLSYWNVSNVTQFTYLFGRCSYLSDISPISNWDISSAIDIGSMFVSVKMTNLNALANWTIPTTLTTIDRIFEECTELTDISGISSWDMSHVQQASTIFSDCTALSDLTPISNWKWDNAVRMDSIFRGCTSLQSAIALDNWNFTSSGGTIYNANGGSVFMSGPFYDTPFYTNYGKYPKWHPNFTGFAILDTGENLSAKLKGLAGHGYATAEDNTITSIVSSNTAPTGTYVNLSKSGVPCYASINEGVISIYCNGRIKTGANLNYMCRYMYKLQSVPALAEWDTSDCTSIGGLFAHCKSLTDISALTNWDTSKFTTLGVTFYNCQKLVDISALTNWNTSNITGGYQAFRQCYGIVDLTPLTNWDMRKAGNIGDMFNRCTHVTSLAPLAGWKVDSLTSLNCTFNFMSAVTTARPLDNWNLTLSGSAVKNSKGQNVDISYIFHNTPYVSDYTKYPIWHPSHI